MAKETVPNRRYTDEFKVEALRLAESVGINQAAKRLKKRLESLESEPESPRKPSRPIKPGTRLLREWRDDTHEVIVCDRSYSYRGQTYTSLSEIARLITGTRWSGPRFFGLKSRDNSEHAR